MSTFNDIRTKFENAIIEAKDTSLVVSIGDKQIGSIDKNDQNTIDHIISLVNSAGSKEPIISFLLDIGYPSNEAETLFSQLSRKNNVELISTYFKNRTITMSNLLGKISNAEDINKSLGLEKGASADFYSFSWRTSPPMGPGEVWLSTILKDGRRPNGAEKGDVIVNGTELEVKGPNGRLVGQSGYGDAKQMRPRLAEAIKNIANNIGILNFTPIDGADNFWNIGKKSAGGIEVNLKEISKLNGGFSSRDISMISEEIITAYRTYLINLDVKKYSGNISKSIGKDGSVDTKKWHAEVLPMFFEYYHSIESFDYIAFTSKKGNFLLITPEDFKSSFRKGLIDFSASPSFTNSAGSQGGTYGITVK